MIKKIPCGGFSYDDTEIAFEDGVIHPIGGGSDAAIENAKETGGFGWTETKSNPLHITWDGDTTGKETVLLEDFELCLVSSKTLESMVGCTVKLDTGDSFIVTDEHIMPFDGGYSVALEAPFCVCVFNDNTTLTPDITFEHKGIYFAKMADEFYTAEISEPAETVHTINPKYISGGVGGNNLDACIYIDSDEVGGIIGYGVQYGSYSELIQKAQDDYLNIAVLDYTFNGVVRGGLPVMSYQLPLVTGEPIVINVADYPESDAIVRITKLCWSSDDEVYLFD